MIFGEIIQLLFQIAAQNCRKRKTDQIAVLEDEVSVVSTDEQHNVTMVSGMRNLVYIRSSLSISKSVPPVLLDLVTQVSGVRSVKARLAEERVNLEAKRINLRRRSSFSS